MAKKVQETNLGGILKFYIFATLVVLVTLACGAYAIEDGGYDAGHQAAYREDKVRINDAYQQGIDCGKTIQGGAAVTGTYSVGGLDTYYCCGADGTCYSPSTVVPAWSTK